MAPLMRSTALFAALCSEVSGLRKSNAKQGTGTLAGVTVHYSEAEGALEDQWMVAFSPKASDAALEAFCAEASCIAMGHPDEGGFAYALVQGSETQLETSIAANAAGIEFIEQDAIAEDFEEEASAAASWGLSAIGVPKSRSKGAGVNVYVLDSGIRVSHRDFGGRAIALYDATYRPPKVCTGSGDARCAADKRGHGSHVAGSVGGESFGVAPASTLYAMERGRSLSDGFGSIDWLVMNKKRPAVLQMSWGTGSLSSVGRIAVDAAVAAGITVTVASGNSNQDACRWTFAGIPSAIAVASTDSTMKRSSFSNFGPCIDILAPGSSIKSASYRSDTGSSVMSGTSMAAPHVAGAAALILEESPQMSPKQVLQTLQSNARRNVINDAKSENDYFLTVGDNGLRQSDLSPLNSCSEPVGHCGRAYQACCIGFGAGPDPFPCDCKLADGNGSSVGECGTCGSAYAVCCAAYGLAGNPCKCDVK